MIWFVMHKNGNLNFLNFMREMLVPSEKQIENTQPIKKGI
jgi:hypothetical protein